MPETVTGIEARADGAGPLFTEPSATENALMWHGQLMTPLATEATVQPWWVHTAVNALNVPAVGCVTTIFWSARIVPPPTGTSAVGTSMPLAAGALDDAAALLAAGVLAAGVLAAGVPAGLLLGDEPHAAVTAAAAATTPPVSRT